MKINEKYLEMFTEQLTQKGYDGKFYAIHVEETDLRNCIDGFLDLQNGPGGSKYKFPMNLGTFADGARWDNKYTQCVFEVDYDQVGGLYIASMEAFQQSERGGEVVGIKINVAGDIPSKAELLAMDFYAEKLRVRANERISKGFSRGPLLNAEHLDHFIQVLNSKGYTGKFMAPDVSERELAHTMLAYLKARPAGIGIQNAFPVWIQTITQGSLMTDQRTICMMKVQYDPGKGFVPDQLRIIRFDARKGMSINEPEPILLKSINELPAAQKANSLAIKNQKAERKRRRKKW